MVLVISTRTRRGAGCGTGSNFGLEAPGRMPGPRGAGILPAACNSQVSREDGRAATRIWKIRDNCSTTELPCFRRAGFEPATGVIFRGIRGEGWSPARRQGIVKHSFNRCSFTGIRRAGGIVSDGARRSLHGLGQDAPATWRDCFRRSKVLLARTGAGSPSH
jgi:hypothetical protein